MPAESVAFTYDGVNTVTATITGAVVGHEYTFYTDIPTAGETGIASGPTLVLSATGTPLSPDDVFQMVVFDTGDSHLCGYTLGSYGTEGEMSFEGVWDFDGDDTVTFTGVLALGFDYQVGIVDVNGDSEGSPVTGSGVSATVTATSGAPATGDYFYAILWDGDTNPGGLHSVRMFTTGEAGPGAPGNPTTSVPANGRFLIALDGDPLDETPTWTIIDDPAGTWRVEAWTSTTGRSTERDKTDPGTATITIVDRDGTFDPTNPFSVYATQFVPGKQAGLLLQNAVTGDWAWRFRGFVQDIEITLDAALNAMRVTVELVDVFNRLAGFEMMAGQIGDTAPAGADGGDIYFDETSGPRELAQRIDDILDTIGWPVALRRVFTGNVQLQATTYAIRDQVLAPILDAADAEFPGVANVYVAKDGIIVFHGRLARFDPESYEATSDMARSGSNSIVFWHVGTPDVTSGDASIVPIRSLTFGISAGDVINDALSLPAHVDETDIAPAWVQDATSKAAYGAKSVTFTDLIVLSGPSGETAVEHATAISEYWVDNYKNPRERIRQLVIVSHAPAEFNAAATWEMLCGVDIADVLTVTTNHPGGGGFAADYFVERIETQAAPGSGGYDLVTMTLDVSPRAFYDTDPFAT